MRQGLSVNRAPQDLQRLSSLTHRQMGAWDSGCQSDTPNSPSVCLSFLPSFLPQNLLEGFWPPDVLSPGSGLFHLTAAVTQSTVPIVNQGLFKLKIIKVRGALDASFHPFPLFSNIFISAQIWQPVSVQNKKHFFLVRRRGCDQKAQTACGWPAGDLGQVTEPHWVSISSPVR